jgi:hypothetical protein
MNDLLRDGATLERIERDLNSHRALYGADDYFLTQALKAVKKMLAEKTKLIEEQTKADEMTFKEYESFMQNKGFDPQFLIDQQVARQDELKIDNDVA